MIFKLRVLCFWGAYFINVRGCLKNLMLPLFEYCTDSYTFKVEWTLQIAKFVMFLLAEQLKRKITKSTAADFSPPLSLDWLIFFPQSL